MKVRRNVLNAQLGFNTFAAIIVIVIIINNHNNNNYFLETYVLKSSMKAVFK